MSDSIKQLTSSVKAFCEARDWDQFHGPKDLAIGVSTEASELLEMFRFLSKDEEIELVTNLDSKEKIEEELADVLFFLLRFSQRFEIDIGQALVKKIEINEEKYPVEKARGSNQKSTLLK